MDKAMKIGITIDYHRVIEWWEFSSLKNKGTKQLSIKGIT